MNTRFATPAGTYAFSAAMGGLTSELTGGNFWEGAAIGVMVSGLNHLKHNVLQGGKKANVLRSTREAMSHYFKGNGSPAEIDESSQLELRNSEEYLIVVRLLISGEVNNLNSSFDVDMTLKVVHIGRTNVDYSTRCAGGNCTTTFIEFVNDGFYDVDFIDENLLGRMGVPFLQPDGLGPNLERFGGTPYMYIPSTFKITYPNPGY